MIRTGTILAFAAGAAAGLVAALLLSPSEPGPQGPSTPRREAEAVSPPPAPAPSQSMPESPSPTDGAERPGSPAAPDLAASKPGETRITTYTPAGPLPIRKAHPLDAAPDAEVVALLTRAAASSGTREDLEAWRYASSTVSLVYRRGLLVPGALVDRFLAHESAHLRDVGISLSLRTRPVPWRRLVEIVNEDPDVQCREHAVNLLGEVAAEHPEAGEVVIQTALDPATSADIRSSALAAFDSVGGRAVDVALALLVRGDFDPAHVKYLARVVVRHDRVEEVLASRPSLTVIRALVKDLKRRFSFCPIEKALLLPIELATAAGDTDRLFAILETEDDYPERRKVALICLLGAETTRSGALAIAERLLRDPVSTTELRINLLQGIVEDVNEAGDRETVRRLVERVAREDRTSWVRDAARRLLKGYFDK